MIRVGFTLIGGGDWTGGRNYLQNLVSVLGRFQKDRLTPILFVGDICGTDDVGAFADIPGLELVKTPLLNVARRSSSLAQALMLGCDVDLMRLFRKHSVDLIFESAQFFGWRLGIPAIAWIPDFQHRALPQLFSRSAWWKREIGFRVQVSSGRTIMLSSDDARYECERYYPATRGRTRAVHFAVPPGPETDGTHARKIAESYGLLSPFFFMPNQFWRHKNHDLVLDALNLLRIRGRQVIVAASGRQHDPRNPEHFPAFRTRLAQMGLEDNLRLLGMVPYQHLALLMRASTAMLNPSLFEGWSTTVEEARSIGTPMLLSDLAVHREQMGSEAIYFNRYSARSLADALDRFVPLDEAQRVKREQVAAKAARQRTERFSKDFVELAEECLVRYGRS